MGVRGAGRAREASAVLLLLLLLLVHPVQSSLSKVC